MSQRKDENDQSDESLFERWLREKRVKKLLARNNALFFGLCIMFALFAAQGMFTIQ